MKHEKLPLSRGWRLIRIAITALVMRSSLCAQSFDSALAAELQFTIDSMRNAYELKGISACVMHPTIGTWKGVTGISHPGVPITSDMEFGIASNTKLFTGVLLLKLAENNLLSLDDSLHQYLPELTNISPEITIRQLLNHTSGLFDVTTIEGYPDSVLSNPNRIFTPQELLTWAEAPLFAPGSDWSYCNTNYLLAGMLAESVTGQSYGQLLRDSILNPLQLDSTFLDVYDSVLNVVAHPWQGGVDNSLVPRKALNSAAWAAGAMYSTSSEMAQWYRALMDGAVIRPESINEMATFVGSGNYGIGISEAILAGRTVWLHGGTIWGGYNSTMLYDPVSGAVISVLINQLPAQAFIVAGQLLEDILSHLSASAYNENNAAIHLRIFPNPADDFVCIDLADQNFNNIKIYNGMGQFIQEFDQPGFSVINWPAGIYWVQVQTAYGIHTAKLLKE